MAKGVERRSPRRRAAHHLRCVLALGQVPAAMRAILSDLLPTFTDAQKESLKGSADFFGLNHYGTGWASDSAERYPLYCNVSE